MRLYIYLGSNDDFFSIDLFETDFVTKWIAELRWCLDNCEFNQQEAFASLLTLEEAAANLKKNCEIINLYLPGMIDIKDDIINQPQEYFNQLHEIFEKINGGFDRPTRLWTVAPDQLKAAVRNLNFFVHRVEIKRPAQPKLYISFDKNRYRRQPLDTSDYDNFEFCIKPGTLFLHYCELGKEFLNLFEDNLPIHYDNFRNLHYYSGEASLSLAGFDLSTLPGFFTWIRAQGFDPWDRKLGHGRIPLGTVDNIDRAQRLLYNHRHLQKILIEE